MHIASLIGLFTLASIATCETRRLLLGDADRGRNVFRSQQCATCHSVNREGGKIGPDLAQMAERGFTPCGMTAVLWNHAPAMWKTLEKTGTAQPKLTRQQAADLFIYFFAMRYFERPGDARRGERVFREQKCGQCHGINDSLGNGVVPVRDWQSPEHPIVLAQQMWSHPSDVWITLRPAATPFPHLTPEGLTDMLVYLRSVMGRHDSGYFMPGSPEEGRKLFVVKGCAACHEGNRSLEGRPTRYTLNDFSAAMWNHPQPALPERISVSTGEMRRLVGYLISAQFFEEHGNAGRGKLLFRKKRCVECHESPSGRVLERTAMAGRMTSYDMMAVLWNHGPAMNKTMGIRKINWPRFDGAEMADLTAYLHGYEFKRRAPVMLP